LFTALTGLSALALAAIAYASARSDAARTERAATTATRCAAVRLVTLGHFWIFFTLRRQGIRACPGEITVATAAELIEAAPITTERIGVVAQAGGIAARHRVVAGVDVGM